MNKVTKKAIVGTDNMHTTYKVTVSINGIDYSTQQVFYNGYSNDSKKNYIINGIIAEFRKQLDKDISNELRELFERKE